MEKGLQRCEYPIFQHYSSMPVRSKPVTREAYFMADLPAFVWIEGADDYRDDENPARSRVSIRGSLCA
jgi:hypothetical protein